MITLYQDALLKVRNGEASLASIPREIAAPG
jgi:hypothetical protein